MKPPDAKGSLPEKGSAPPLDPKGSEEKGLRECRMRTKRAGTRPRRPASVLTISHSSLS